MKRPFSATLALWVVLFTLVWNIVRMWTAIAWHSVLAEFSVSLQPTVSAIIGGTWTAVSYFLYWSIWQRKAWAGKMLLGTATSYTFWYWGERLFFQNPRPNAFFAVIVNLGLMIVIYFAYKSISREAYERENENPAIE
jgi:hypothetical protein